MIVTKATGILIERNNPYTATMQHCDIHNNSFIPIPISSSGQKWPLGVFNMGAGFGRHRDYNAKLQIGALHHPR
jgi:hypothetical protein